MKGASEPRTIAGFREGDLKSLTLVFNLYHKPLFVFADNLIGNEQEAQDIVAEAFIKIWQIRREFEYIHNIQAYLYTVVRHACFGYLKKYHRVMQAQKEISYLSDTALSEEDIMQAKIESFLVEIVFEEVEKLPKKCRTIFKMVLLENLSTVEIAERLHIAKKTVLSQKARAIALLKIAILKRKLVVLCSVVLTKYLS